MFPNNILRLGSRSGVSSISFFLIEQMMDAHLLVSRRKFVYGSVVCDQSVIFCKVVHELLISMDTPW